MYIALWLVVKFACNLAHVQEVMYIGSGGMIGYLTIIGVDMAFVTTILMLLCHC